MRLCTPKGAGPIQATDSAFASDSPVRDHPPRLSLADGLAETGHAFRLAEGLITEAPDPPLDVISAFASGVAAPSFDYCFIHIRAGADLVHLPCILSRTNMATKDLPIAEAQDLSTDEKQPSEIPNPTADTGVLHGWRLATVFAMMMLSLFLFALDQSIVSTAVPVIASAFDAFDEVSWVSRVGAQDHAHGRSSPPISSRSAALSSLSAS